MELSDKLKNEIVESQIKEIKKDGNKTLNYEIFQAYLEKGISNVFQTLSGNLDNLEELQGSIDRNLLESLEDPSSGSASRLYHGAKAEGIYTNKQLLESYKSQDLLKFRNVGMKPFNLAGRYLTKKGFIKE